MGCSTMDSTALALCPNVMLFHPSFPSWHRPLHQGQWLQHMGQKELLDVQPPSGESTKQTWLRRINFSFYSSNNFFGAPTTVAGTLRATVELFDTFDPVALSWEEFWDALLSFTVVPEVAPACDGDVVGGAACSTEPWRGSKICWTLAGSFTGDGHSGIFQTIPTKVR